MTKTFKSRLLGVLLAMLLVVMGLIGVSLWNGGSVTAYAASDVNYVDANGNTKTANNVIEVMSGATLWGKDNTTSWYVVNSDVSFSNRISCYGDVNLILGNGKKLTVDKGIGVSSDASITIYAQSTDYAVAGSIIHTGDNWSTNNALIGGNETEIIDSIIINGGNVKLSPFATTTASTRMAAEIDGACIGAGSHGTCGKIVINNANITCNLGRNNLSSVIGTGSLGDCDNIIINNSTVDVTYLQSVGSIIGAAQQGYCHYINIYNTTLKMSGKQLVCGSAISCENTIEILDSKINTEVEIASQGAHIGSNKDNDCSLISIIDTEFEFCEGDSTYGDDADYVGGKSGGISTVVNTNNVLLQEMYDNQSWKYATYNYFTCTYDDNGFCNVHSDGDADCTGTYEPCKLNADGYYEIANGGNMFWFAEKVNAGNYSINGKIVANEIDLENRNWTPIGLYNASSSGAFTGNFDGGNASIIHFRRDSDGEYFGEGFFGYVANATIKNFSLKGYLGLANSVNSSNITVGGIVGNLYHNSIIENVVSNVCIGASQNSTVDFIGGVVGKLELATMKKCIYTETINLSLISLDRAGGILGYAQYSYNGQNLPYVADCAMYGKIDDTNCISYGTAGGIIGHTGNEGLSMENCVFAGELVGTFTKLSAFGNWNKISSDKIRNFYCYSKSTKYSICTGDKASILQSKVTSVTETQLRNGEVAWLLNGGKEDGTQAWYQTIDSDDNPTFSGETVYKNIVGGCTEEAYAYGYANEKKDVYSHYCNNMMTVIEHDGRFMFVCAECESPDTSCLNTGLNWLEREKPLYYTGKVIAEEKDLYYWYPTRGDVLTAIRNQIITDVVLTYSETADGDFSEVSEVKLPGFYKAVLTCTQRDIYHEDVKALSIENSFEVQYRPLDITFKDYDGSIIKSETVDGQNVTEITVPNYTIPSNDYYTYTFKYWHCEETGKDYTTENLPTYEDLCSNYSSVTFRAVYDIKYKKDFYLEGSIDSQTGLSKSGIYGSDKNVKIVNNGEGVDVYTNYAIKNNGGIASLLLIPEYNKTVFDIQAVSVNGQLVYGTGATSTELLSGWTVTVTGSEVATDAFKIVLEKLPISNATGDMFIQIVYTTESAVTGEYNFGFVTKYLNDTADTTTDSNLTHNDRSEAYGVLSNDEIASLCELKITVEDATIILVARQDATIEIKNDSVIYDANVAEVEEDCKALAEELKNILTYHYSAYGTKLADGSEYDKWLDYITIKWYDADGNVIDVPKNVGNYKLGISAAQNDYYNAVDEQKFDVTITPYAIDVSAEKLNDKTYNGEDQTWTKDDFTITDVISALNDETGYKLAITNATYKNAGTYNVTLTFTATSNYTFTENGLIANAGDTKVIDVEVIMNKFAFMLAATNQTSEYSDDIQTLGLKYPTADFAVNYAFVFTDIQNNTLRFTPSTKATSDSGVGTYDITITIEGSSAGNYDVTLIHNQDKINNIDGHNGTYTITQKGVEIPTIADLTYNGAEQFPEVTDAATINGKVAYSFSGDRKIDAGNYKLMATLASKNYKWNSETISADKLDTKLDWKIVKATLTVTIGEDWTSKYSDELVTIVGTAEGLMGKDTLDSIGVTYERQDEKFNNGFLSVGKYVVKGKYSGTNYIVTFVDGKYTVTKKDLDDDELQAILASIIGAKKDYTGNELAWSLSDFAVTGDVNGVNYSDIISISNQAAVSETDYTNANGKLDGDTWTYWDPETKLYYTVTVTVNTDYQDSYMLYKDGDDEVYTKDGVEVEVFIAQATNDWTVGPSVNAENIDKYKAEADAKFKADGEVAIEIKDSEGNTVTEKDLVVGKTYNVIFTVKETNNYTGLTDTIELKLGYAYISLPNVYLDEENGTVCVANESVTITYDGLTHKFVIVPTGEGKYTITVNTGDDYASWKNALGEYSITISLTDNYSWSADDREDKTYTLNINKASLTVTATTYNVSFGTAIESYETTADGFVNGENYATYGKIDVDSYLTCAYVAGDQVRGKVGSYDITFGTSCQSDLEALLANYNVTLQNGAVNVTAMKLGLDLSKLESRFYKCNWTTWEYWVQSGYTVEYNSETQTFYLNEMTYPEQLVPTISYNDLSDLPKNAGVYTISVVFNIADGLDENNYTWENPKDTVTLTITKVKLTLTAQDQTVYYIGEALYNEDLSMDAWTMSPTYDDKPFMRNEIDYLWIEIIDPNYDSFIGYGLGVYEGVLKVHVEMKDGYTLDNYDITYINGTLTHEKGTLTWAIELTTVNREYNGKGLTVGTESVYDDYFAKVNVSDYDFSQHNGNLAYSFYTKNGENYSECSSTPIYAGTYYVKAVYTDDIHVDLISEYVEIVISKASVTVTATAQDVNYLQNIIYGYVSETMNKYGDSEQSVKYEFSNDNGATWVSNPEDKWFVVGTYQVKAIVNESANYQGAEDIATFNVKQATLKGVTFKYNLDTATWEAITQTADNEDINKYGNVTVTYKVIKGETVLKDNFSECSFVASGFEGIPTLIASIENNNNFIASESDMLEVFSITFKDTDDNHDKNKNELYDFSKIAPKQYRFQGQKATQPDCCNKDADIITITGYTFAKSFETVEDGTFNFSSGIYESLTLFAQWDINTYTVTWMNDNNKLQEEEYEYLEVPSYNGETPTRATTDEYIFTFDGWSLTIDGEKVSLSAVTDNITYYAYYTKEGVTYKITFMVSEDGGEYKEYKTIEAAKFGDTLTELYNLKKVAWFRGDVWYADEARTQVLTTMLVPTDVEKGVTVYGAYVFDIGNGDVNASGDITTDDITLYREWVVGGYEMTIVKKGTEWTLASAEGFNPYAEIYFIERVADVNADTSDDIRDITTIRMAIVGGYGYRTIWDVNVTGEEVAIHKHTSDGVYEVDETNHWLVCAECREEYRKAAHIDADNNGYCDVCGECMLWEVETTSDGERYRVVAYKGDTIVTELTIPDKVYGREVEYYDNGLLSECTSLETITCRWIYYNGNGLASFWSANGDSSSVPETLTTVIIADNVTEIPYHAFEYCTNIKKIEIPSSVTIIGSNAFAGSGIQSIVIPEGVTEVEREAFMRCSELESIVISKNVKTIDYCAFVICAKLSKVYYTGTAEEWNQVNIDSANDSLTAATIYYYSESAPTDTTYTYWHYDANGVPTLWE